MTAIVECRVCHKEFEVDVLQLPAGQWWRQCPNCNAKADADDADGEHTPQAPNEPEE